MYFDRLFLFVNFFIISMDDERSEKAPGLFKNDASGYTHYSSIFRVVFDQRDLGLEIVQLLFFGGHYIRGRAVENFSLTSFFANGSNNF